MRCFRLTAGIRSVVFLQAVEPCIFGEPVRYVEPEACDRADEELLAYNLAAFFRKRKGEDK